MKRPDLWIPALLSAVVATGVSLAFGRGEMPVAVPTVAGDADQLSRLADELAALQLRTDQLEGARASDDRRSVAGSDDRRIADAVEDYLARRTDRADTELADGDDAAGAPLDLETAKRELAGQSYWKQTKLWRAAFEAGHMQELIDHFKSSAKERPQDAAAQMSLGNAYMAVMQMDQSQWHMALKADQQYDKVLELDVNHWEARFTKAVQYTFWPDFLGKKKEAIRHFETLLTQQDKLPVEDHHAQTYLFLGNMLIERDPERAREVWSRGLRRHPDDRALREKVGS